MWTGILKISPCPRKPIKCWWPYPTPGIVAPDLIEKIEAFGPDSYQVALANQKFGNIRLNGWFYTPKIQNYWYKVNLPTGFLKEGEYTIEVPCKDGRTVKKSRVQNTFRRGGGSVSEAQNHLRLLC
jgi:hypothetical protein